MSVTVKLPTCDTPAFLRLSQVEGFNLALIHRVWIICWKFYCMIMGIGGAAKNVYRESFFWCEICHQAENKVMCFLDEWFVCTVVT